jgi:hypothetical protein
MHNSHCSGSKLESDDTGTSNKDVNVDIKLGTAMAIDADANAAAAANDGGVGVEVELDSTSITYDSDDDLSYDTLMSEDQGSGCGSDDCNDSHFHASGNGGGSSGSNYNTTIHKDLLWLAARRLGSESSMDVDVDVDVDADVDNKQRLPPVAVKSLTKDANDGCDDCSCVLRHDDPILLDLDLSLLENNGKDRDRDRDRANTSGSTYSNISGGKFDKCASGTGTGTSSIDLLQLLMDDDDDSALLSEDEDDVHIDLGGDAPNRSPSSPSSPSSSPTSKTKDMSKISSYTEQYLAQYSTNATATFMTIPPPSSLPHSHSREVDLMTLDEEELQVHLNFCDFDQPLFTIMEGEQLLYMNEWINEALFIHAAEEDDNDEDDDEKEKEKKVKVREEEEENIKAQEKEQEKIEEIMAKDEDEHGTCNNETNDIENESSEIMITENHYDYDMRKNNELELAKQIDEEDDLSEEEEFDFEYIPNYYSAPSISASASPDSDSDIDYAGIDYIGAGSFSFPYSLSGSDSVDFDSTNSALTIAATTSAVLSSFTCGTSWSAIQDEEDEGDYDNEILEEMRARVQIESLLSSSQLHNNSGDEDENENENELHTSTPMQFMDDTLFTIQEEPGAEKEADEEEEPKNETEPQVQKEEHMEVFQTASTASIVSPKSSTALENALFLQQDFQPKSKPSCSTIEKALFLQQDSQLKSKQLSATPSIPAEPKQHAEDCKDLGLGLELEPGLEIEEEEQDLCDDYESECEWITTYSNTSTYTDQDQDANTETKSEDPLDSTVEVITDGPGAITSVRTSEVKRRTSLLQQIRTRSSSKKNSDGSRSAKSRYSKQHISSSSLPHLEAEDSSNPNPADESIQNHEPTTSFGISTLPLYYLKQSFNLR